MVRCTFAHVNLAALQANFRTIAAFLAGRAQAAAPGVIAVVKANAYGHGAARVGLALEEAGATMLACADIEEGIVLREAGVEGDILVFGALSLSDLDGLFRYDLTPTISTPSAAEAVQREAARRGRRVRYHLKIDTGMNRLGFRHDNLRATMPPLLASPNLELAAVYTHFATADEPADELFVQQQARFDGVLRQLAALGAPPVPRHAANSASLLRDPYSWFDYVRPGILLYGITPPAFRSRLDLRPVMTLRSRVVAVKGVRPGETIGYGARSPAGHPRTIAIVPAGYADGLDLRLAGRASVLVRGRRAPIVGSVCMDMMTIDVSHVPVDTGDEVVILGAQGGDAIDVREMAAAIGSIPYEILCRIGTRIERVYNS